MIVYDPRLNATCNRCGGVMLPNNDRYGHWIACLACGQNIDTDRQGRPLVALPLATLGYRQRHRPPAHRGREL